MGVDWDSEVIVVKRKEYDELQSKLAAKDAEIEERDKLLDFARLEDGDSLACIELANKSNELLRKQIVQLEQQIADLTAQLEQAKDFAVTHSITQCCNSQIEELQQQLAQRDRLLQRAECIINADKLIYHRQCSEHSGCSNIQWLADVDALKHGGTK